jgi:peroxiredoxin
MNKAALIAAPVLIFLLTLSVNGQTASQTDGPWTGVLINAACTLDEAFSEAAKCSEADPGAKLELYADSVRRVYQLDPQSKVNGKIEDSVEVHGTLENGTIHVTSMKPIGEVGLAVGQKAPAFSLPDQFGQVQTLETLRGSKGTVLLFYRSADGCPYCKGQLIQLQAAKARFDKEGLKLAGISYDSVDILKFFSGRRNIEFPLLADPNSQVIREYKVLNSEGSGRDLGMARPGYFYIDTEGVIREKFFEAKYRDRLTGNNVLAKIFPELGEEVSDSVEGPHMQLVAGQSDRAAMPGNLVTLTAEITLPPDVHVYAAGAKGYKPIRLEIEPSPELELHPSVYPRSKILFLPAINERVPVFEGKFRIRQDLRVNSTNDFSNKLPPEGETVTIKGKLEYQACDKKICFMPTSVPIEWHLQVLQLDRQRAPEDIRHKGNPGG